MNKLSIRPLAQKDLREIMLYYREINHTLATKFLHETDACIFQIQHYPEAFQKRTKEVHIVYLKTFPFGIFYKIYPLEIRVIAFLHTSRDPKIWKKRNK
ncbi:MAG: type II toxin-antitoxin system RelE/ParE family toxin [Aequorivita antarctica]